MAADIRMVSRDPLLAIMPFVPFLAAGALRVLLPPLSGFIEGKTGFRLLDWADLVRAVIILFPGMFYGTVAGFLLLDDRDDGVSGYWGVTPAGRAGYLGARLGLFSAGAFVAGILAARVFGLGRPDLAREIGAAVVGASQAAFYALFLAAFAADKVEGLSVIKALGGLDLAPLAVLVALPVRAAAWLFPQYWAAEIMLGRNAPPAIALAAGAVTSVLWIAVLFGKYRRRIE
jgi:fluoroquinolone transport system permease protein